MKKIIFSLSTLLMCSVSSPHTSLSSEMELKKIYFKLAGKNLSPRHPKKQEWLLSLEEGKLKEVAFDIMNDPSFIDQISLRWGSFYLTSEKKMQIPLNDALASVVGIIKDERDARDLLLGDYVYGPTLRLGGGRPNPRSNEIYSIFENRLLSLASLLQLYTPQWEIASFKESAGLLSSRWWGETYYQGGTNRRSVVGLMDTFLCSPIETWKTSGLPTRRIRQDIPRDPSGDPRIFHQECRSCHAPMDGLAGAFANFDFVNGSLVYQSSISSKYFNNDHTYPEGFRTEDNSWVNFLGVRKDLGLEWSSKIKGAGLRELGQMVVDSGGFSNCLAKRSVSFFCNKQLKMNDPWILELSHDFSNEDNFKLKNLFFKIATSERCH